MRHALGAVAAVVAVAMAMSLGCSGAYALTDTVVSTNNTVTVDSAQALESLSKSAASTANAANAASGAQTQQLPETVAESIPDDATIVSPELAVTPGGEVKHVETGETVTDPAIVGTEDTPPDPLAKTDGKSYIPVKVEDAKAQGAARTVPDAATASNDANTQSDAANTASASAYQGAPSVSSAVYLQGSSSVLAAAAGNAQGAYWGTYNNTPAFFQSNGAAFVQDAKWVVDVSNWNGTIDWDKAKAAGVQGAIIRIGYGWGNAIDKQAQRNISECKRLGIPFGVYLYSYAYDANFAAGEGESTVNLLRQAGVSPSDLGYSVYYDLEQWSWAGHTPPTDPGVYEQIARAWNQKLWDAGYRNTAFYSYTSYLNGPLNNAYVHGGVDWVAQYAGRITYTNFPNRYRGWQYTASGYVDGIGAVDLNAFGNAPEAGGTAGPAFEVKGDMGAEWQRIGGSSSKIGNPVANEVCDWTPGKVNCYQNFERGAISWTPGTGAHYTTGQLRTEWANRNFEHGVMGYPVADEEDLGNGWWRQEFQSGYIWAKGTTSYVLLNELRQSYDQHKGFSMLGGPTANEENIGDGWWRQRFENGDVWTRGTTVKLVIQHELWRAYMQYGDVARLGAPVADEEDMGNGWWRQRCEHGDVWTRGTTEQHLIQRELRDSYEQHGGADRLGAPVADEEDMGNGYWRQRCENGDVWTRGTTEKYVIMHTLRQTYYDRGGFEVLGGPTSDERHTGTVWQQDCQNGTIEVI